VLLSLEELVMTKAELMQNVAALPRFKGLIEGPVLEKTTGVGDNIYRCNVRALKQGSSMVIQYINSYFTVIDEGGPGEDAYILDRGMSDLYA